MTSVSPDFGYWNSVNPAEFLAHDWENPSRKWAAEAAVKAANGGELLEVGPGPGVDYDRYFRTAALTYTGVEGSANLFTALCARFPDGRWANGTIADLPALSADVVYARHVLEHQPALEPALSQLLGAARHAVILTWYRPPGPVAFHEVWRGVHCRTFARADVFAAIDRARFRLVDSKGFFSGDEAWVLNRV
jgi:hypothetical protein